MKAECVNKHAHFLLQPSNSVDRYIFGCYAVTKTVEAYKECNDNLQLPYCFKALLFGARRGKKYLRTVVQTTS